MGELVGEEVFEQFGLDFPLLIKNLDCNDTLSVQVHPNDELAEERHNSFGKTEMWYISDAEEGAVIYLGFKNKNINREEYIQAVAEGTVADILQAVPVKKGDVFFIPAGTVHALAKGLNVIEIQQTSDITYRIFDWNRADVDGKPRELHLDQASQVVRLEPQGGLRITKHPKTGSAEELTSCEQFTVNLIAIDGTIELDYAPLDSFVAYMCVEGEVTITGCGESESIKALETVLIPAEATDIVLRGKGRLLEVFIK
jgi:mannose-6-phosphate isomerase